MNWYKKSQLKESLPYFQEFEEEGEYVPNENSLNKKLELKGLFINNEIGRGDSGVAYSLSNGDVLKITTNDQEGRVASYFVNNPHQSTISYKSVWKEGDLYFIIMEKVEDLLSNHPDLLEIFSNLTYITEKEGCYSPKCAYSIILKNSYFKSLPKEYSQTILEYLYYLKSIPIGIYDFLNPSNIGIKNGKIKFFDVT